jgi:DNA (cytosine-5)-methyltransferase 1
MNKTSLTNEPTLLQKHSVSGTCFSHLGLFEGIGGFSLAAHWMGWETKAWCEWNEFGQKVLRHHFPNAEGFGDITKTDFTKYANTIDILTGGFPCQPYSLAGKRKGKKDERHLWPEMLRAIREIQPTYVVGENVFGLINWNGGLVFNEVQTDLEAEGYEVFPFVLPACAKDAPHRRDRVWFVAHASNKRCNNRSDNRQERCVQGNERTTTEDKPERNGRKRRAGAFGSNATDTKCLRLAQCEQQGQPRCKEGIFERGCLNEHATDTEGSSFERELQQRQEQGEFRRCNCKTTTNVRLLRQTNRKQQTARIIERGSWESFPTESPICSGNDGISDRLDGITFPKWRNESIKAFGNAIVPQVAFEIFKAIEAVHLQHCH